MKRIFCILLLSLLGLGVTFAEDTAEYAQRYRDIESHDYNFQVVINDDRTADLEWNSYLINSGFQYYKLLYSNNFANPSYPEIEASYVGTKLTDTQASLKLTGEENHYFRICSITDRGYGVIGRYCSSTRKFVLPEITMQETEPTTEEAIEKQEETGLSSELQEKLDSRLEIFLARLEAKYDDAQIALILDDIIERLDKYKSRPAYTLMVIYMQSELQDYKTQHLNKIDIFESIFEEYE